MMADALSDLERAALVVRSTNDLVDVLQARYGAPVMEGLREASRNANDRFVCLAVQTWMRYNMDVSTYSQSQLRNSVAAPLQTSDDGSSSCENEENSALPFYELPAVRDRKAHRRRPALTEAGSPPLKKRSRTAEAPSDWSQIPRKRLRSILNEYLGRLRLPALSSRDQVWLDEVLQSTRGRGVCVRDRRTLEGFEQTLEDLLVQVKRELSQRR